MGKCKLCFLRLTPPYVSEAQRLHTGAILRATCFFYVSVSKKLPSSSDKAEKILFLVTLGTLIKAKD